MSAAEKLEREAMAALRNVREADRNAILAWIRFLQAQARETA